MSFFNFLNFWPRETWAALFVASFVLSCIHAAAHKATQSKPKWLEKVILAFLIPSLIANAVSILALFPPHHYDHEGLVGLLKELWSTIRPILLLGFSYSAIMLIATLPLTLILRAKNRTP